MRTTMNIVVVCFALILMSGLGTATTTHVEWNGSGSIHADVENGYSGVRIDGGGSSIEGVFDTHENYDRVEASVREATFENGFYDFQQTNEQKDSNNRIRAVTNGEKGFLDAKTDVWRVGTDFTTNGYAGHDWSWSGTDEQALGVENGFVGLYAAEDSNKNGTAESYYGLNIVTDGKAGVGTHSAGSNDVIQASGVRGDLIIRGEGSGNLDQTFDNVGSFEESIEWN